MMEQIAEVVLKIAREAAAAAMVFYESETFAIEQKADNTPLTEADLAANKTIVEGLTAKWPDIPIISEEMEVDDQARRDAERVWLVDPIDGTKEFIDHNGEFTINIALIERGEPIFGVVLAPAKQLEYWGGRDVGAWKSENGQTPQSISVFTGERPLIASGSRSHAMAEEDAWLAEQNVAEIKHVGSSLKVCYVADGTVDVYPRFTTYLHEWDIAAADAVLRAAGGLCADMKTGQPLVYNQKDLHLGPFVAKANAVTF
jgi:3'(2'), 5'-bisphosphate nucleotidase